MLLPPGRRVYQKGSYTLWEIDGAQQPVCSSLDRHYWSLMCIAVLPESKPFREIVY